MPKRPMVGSHPPSDTTRHRKAELRNKLKARRLDVASPGEKADRLARVCLDFVLALPGPIAGYWPLPGEIDPRPLLTDLALRGCTLCLPVVQGKAQALTFRDWVPGDPLSDGPFGTKHPIEEAPLCRPATFLLPLLGFDRTGSRLGYGGGYYDRTLSDLPNVKKIGMAFACQEEPNLPRQSHDVTMDALLCEQGVFVFSA